MRVELILGCWGREQDNFNCCSGTTNVILDITKNTERNVLIAEFLDKVYGLFDKPLYLNVHTALWSLQDKFSDVSNPVFSKKFFKQIEEFCVAHKKCGVYLRLNIKETEEIGEEMSNMVFILDIDGTVCDSNQRVKEVCERAGKEFTMENVDKLFSSKEIDNFFKTEEIEKDIVIPGSDKVFNLVKKFNAELIYITGRNERFRDITSKWLIDNCKTSKDTKLIMRTKEFESVKADLYKETVFLDQVYQDRKDSIFWFFDDDDRALIRYSKYGVAFKAPDCWGSILC